MSAAASALIAVPWQQDARTIGVVGVAHATSHFFHLLLPPLFPAFIQEFGLSYLFITHNIGVVEYIADVVAVMRGGAIVEQGTCGAVLGSPRHEYTRELLAAVPRLVQPA